MRKRSGFWVREDGGVAASTAMLVTPLLLAAAVAVDISQLHRIKANVQMAVDAAATGALQIGNKNATTKSKAQAAQALFDANLPNLDPFHKLKVTFHREYDRGAEKIAVIAVGEVDTLLMGLFGRDQSAIRASKGFRKGQLSRSTRKASIVIRRKQPGSSGGRKGDIKRYGRKENTSG